MKFTTKEVAYMIERLDADHWSEAPSTAAGALAKKGLLRVITSAGAPGEVATYMWCPKFHAKFGHARCKLQAFEQVYKLIGTRRKK